MSTAKRQNIALKYSLEEVLKECNKSNILPLLTYLIYVCMCMYLCSTKSALNFLYKNNFRLDVVRPIILVSYQMS